MPRFYPNVVTLQPAKAVAAEQREAIDLLVKSNLPDRWSVKDSFRTLDLSRLGFELLFEARWIRNAMPMPGLASDIVWQREVKETTKGAAGLPVGDPDFAMFTGRRGFRVVAGGMLYRAEGVVGLSNVVADTADARAVWRSLALLAAQTFPRLPLVGYESGEELKAASDAGFEIGDKLRIWVRSKD